MTSEIHVRIVRSRRKTLAIQITREAEVIIRAPQHMPETQIRRFVAEKEDWIVRNLQTMQSKQAQSAQEPPFSPADIERMAEKALQDIPERVRHFAPLVGVDYGRITIRSQRTRWGSCSGKGNLNFNCLLMQTPTKVIDYVVVHELCHRLEMNHSERFWAQVERVLPDYKVRRDWLKRNGGALIRRMERGCK